MIMMLMPVMTIRMIMQTAEDDRAAGGTTGRGTKRITEKRAILGNRIQVRCFYDGISIASRVLALVVGDDEHDIFGRTEKGGCPAARNESDQEQHASA